MTTIPAPRALTVKELLDHGELGGITRVVVGESGLSRLVTHPRIQKSGLALVGHRRGIVPTRVQILGETEVSFLAGLDPAARRTAVADFFDLTLSCVIVTRGIEPPSELVDQARDSGTPLVVAESRSSRTINAIHAALDDLLAPTQSVHGVLVDIHGVGVLLLGPSGIGKSECALFLVERGHRLIADDQVVLTLRPSGRVEGKPPPALRYHLEVRGIGVLNVRDLFGATAVRLRKSLDLVVELCPFRRDEQYDRLGLDDLVYEVHGVEIPMLRIPVSPGRDMRVILEVAARNQLLKVAGEHPARRFVESLSRDAGLAPPRVPSAPPPVERDLPSEPTTDPGVDPDAAEVWARRFRDDEDGA